MPASLIRVSLSGSCWPRPSPCESARENQDGLQLAFGGSDRSAPPPTWKGDVLVVLEGTVDYEIEADQLTLRNGDVGLVYRAAP